ncbi:MAG: PAS domain-containing protein [Bacteroidales bacterium]|nr:PAS domain-containing protein [Bacteroidales bacterium]
MAEPNWTNEFDASITVCDSEGTIIEMNKKSIDTFEKYGGAKLIGTNLFDCHPEPARSKLKEMIVSEKSNVYTIEKNGVRKMIIQKPWYEKGTCSGIVEISIEIPAQMEHFVRK